MSETKKQSGVSAVLSTDGLAVTVEAQRMALIDQRAQAIFELAEIDRRLAELCPHSWSWHPVAGDGRYCTKCGKRDFDCDD